MMAKESLPTILCGPHAEYPEGSQAAYTHAGYEITRCLGCNSSFLHAKGITIPWCGHRGCFGNMWWCQPYTDPLWREKQGLG